MGQEQDVVYLVDGSSYLHRAYHAIRHLSNSKGFPTNAAFGVTKMILKLIEDRSPKYAAIVFDPKGPTFRHELFEEYKATRPPMPEDLAKQIPIIKEILENMSLKILEREGYEADDVIGTLSRLSEKHGLRVVIVTGDKDFRQLITPNISLWDTMKNSVIDYSKLKETFGFEPSRFIDVMGLSGDSVDNIPGVPGVGEKTAVSLIKEYGSFEAVFDRLDEIKRKKLKENLVTARDRAVLSKQLVTIDQHVPIDEGIEDLRVGEPNKKALTRIFKDLEFRSLWDQFAERDDSKNGEYNLILTEEELERLVAQIQKNGKVSIDTETTSEMPLRAELVGMSFSLEEGNALYLPLAHQYLGAPKQLEVSRVLELLQGILEDKCIGKIGQNIKYDALVLRSQGIELKGIEFDTMIASYVLNPGLRQHNLDNLSQHYLNHKTISYRDVVGKGKHQLKFSEVDIERAMAYACEDADIPLRLMNILDEQLRSDRNEALFHELEMRLVPVLADMEWAGIKIDSAFFKNMSRRFHEQIKGIEGDIYSEAGMEFNINSPQQLGYVLFEKLQMPVQKKTSKTKSYSTDVKVLSKLAALPYKIPKLLLRYRTLTKLKSTYLDALVKMINPSTGRIHTSFNQTVTATGRLSSSNPNLQNIPIRGEEGREIRKGFVADAGCKLISADYSQVELRVFAHYSSDPSFIDAFNKEEDIHTRTASELLDVDPDGVTTDMRRIAKAINFGIIYGMGPRRLSEELGIDHKTAKQYIEAYYQRYEGVQDYKERMLSAAREKGYVTTLFNRRRYLPNIQHAAQRIRSEAERMAVNTPIQGTAADLIKKAMINIHQRLNSLGYNTKMLLQVHDELVFEVPDEELDEICDIVKEEMEQVHPLDVPLKVDINVGSNWDEAH